MSRAVGQTFRKCTTGCGRKDPSRPVHYESVWGNPEQDLSVTDVYSMMYASPEQAREFLHTHPDRPFLLCEFAHAMGNSCGGVERYTRMLEEEPHMQGAFIWDFVDQAILTKDDRGRDYFAYGGDFGDRPNDGNFCSNGLLFADRTPSPKLAEIRRLYQNISFRALDAERGTIEIGNHFLFTDLSEFEFRWEPSLRWRIPARRVLLFCSGPGENAAVGAGAQPDLPAGMLSESFCSPA